eukprot:1722281-Alexandrium_andersonii.AAC.1
MGGDRQVLRDRAAYHAGRDPLGADAAEARADIDGLPGENANHHGVVHVVHLAEHVQSVLRPAHGL